MASMLAPIKFFRIIRVLYKQLFLIEPIVKRTIFLDLEYHGSDTCGWNIVRNFLSKNSVVVDIGLGEDISFSQSIIDKYCLVVHGFDPTPRSIQYIKGLNQFNFILYEYGIGIKKGITIFYLPNNEHHVSGSLSHEQHLGLKEIQVNLVTIGDIFNILNCEKINLLKLDIEGAEYDLISSQEFREFSKHIEMICIEFHHRWKSFGRESTVNAVMILAELGFRCAWRSIYTNEEFLFVRQN